MDVLDVKGLPEEKVDYLQELIEKWRQEEAVVEVRPHESEEDEDIVFTTQKSRVIGPLTRREIYDYL